MDSNPIDLRKMHQWRAVAPAPRVSTPDLRFSSTAFKAETDDGEYTLVDRLADDDLDRWVVQKSGGTQVLITDEQRRYSYFPEHTDQKTIRIFISSTFQDMHVERNHLITTVFPRLRRLARSMGLQLQEIDLRWGITLEDSRKGKTVAICLNEIDRCRNSPPFFIGILGERYGWIPDPAALADLEREMSVYRNGDASQSIREAAGRNAYSVTEMEFRYGVLENPAMYSHSFFYTRAPELTQLFAESSADSGSGNVYFEDSDESRDRQRALKDELRDSELVRIDGYCSVEDLGNDIEQAISAAIKRIALNSLREVAQFSSPPPLEWERQLAWNAALERDHIDLDRIANIFEVRASWSNPDRLERIRILMVGNPGSGKSQESAALARFLARGSLLEPEIVPLHCRISSISNSDAAIAYVMGAIAAFGGIPKLDKTARLDALEKVNRYFIILITDIDSLPDPAALLDFISRIDTPGLAFVLSCADSELARRKTPRFTVMPLDDLNLAAREKFILQYLARYRKSLARAQLDKFAELPMSGSPLFLVLALDNIRQSSVFDTLTADIARFASFESLDSMLTGTLQYWRDCMGLSASESASLAVVLDALCVSYYGIPEDFIFSPGGANLTPLTWVTWCGLADSVIADVDGYWRFSNDHIRDIVASSDHDGADAHDRRSRLRRRLAAFIDAAPEYTDGIGLHERVQQLSWLLKNAPEPSDIDDLYQSLRQPDNICRLHVIAHALLFECWHLLVRHGYSVAALLNGVPSDKHGNGIWDAVLFELLTEFGCWSELEQAARNARSRLLHPYPEVLEHNLGIALVKQGRYQEAVEVIGPRLMEWAEPPRPHSSIPATLGLLIGMISDGDVDSASWLAVIDAAVKVFLDVGYVSEPYGDAAVVVSIVDFLFRTGQYESVEPLARRGFTLSYSLREPFGPRLRLMLAFPLLSSLRTGSKLKEAITLGQRVLDEPCEPFQADRLFRARCCRAMAQTFIDLKQWHDALPLLEYALAHEPQDETDFVPLLLIHAFLAKTLMELGEFTRMNDSLVRYASYFSGDPALAMQLRSWLLAELLRSGQLGAYRWLDRSTPAALS